MLESIIISICLAALITATISDIRTREVPDWISYGLMISALGIRTIFSISNSDWTFIAFGAAGFAGFAALGFLMFYTGQWGGGDAKIMMGLGGLLGLDFMNPGSLLTGSIYISFIVNLIMIGAIYGLLWSMVAAAVKFKAFGKEFKKAIKGKKWQRIRRVVLAMIALMIIGAYFTGDFHFSIMLLSLSVIMLITLYVYPFVKSVENACMYRLVMPEELTEGDWIADDVNIAGELICGPKDLGIGRKQIEKLKRHYMDGRIEKIRIKVGIPFLPSFLIAFVLALWLGNIVMLAFL